MTLKLTLCLLIGLAMAGRLTAAEQQVLELRRYTLVDEAAEEKLDAYLGKALVPALERQGLGPIGVFEQADKSGDAPPQVLVLIVGPSADAVTGSSAKLQEDKAYQQAAKEYLETPADKPLVKRIESELLLSFEAWPEVKASKQKQAGKSRLFELRTYESPTEHLGNLKVEMFNTAELDIFFKCDIEPVFMGQALVGSQIPNLTYMTVYDDSAERDACWKRFIEHPEWAELKEVKRYLGTVSKIDKSDWVPKPYSQL
jgi:hypothetical protein